MTGRDLTQRTEPWRVMPETTPTKKFDGLPPGSGAFIYQENELCLIINRRAILAGAETLPCNLDPGPWY
jgi:hypothetical protein